MAQENMDVFKDAWERQVRILTEAVDDITTIDDFLAVSESHILEDVNKCVLALQVWRRGRGWALYRCAIRMAPSCMSDKLSHAFCRLTSFSILVVCLIITLDFLKKIHPLRSVPPKLERHLTLSPIKGKGR